MKGGAFSGNPFARPSLKSLGSRKLIKPVYFFFGDVFTLLNVPLLRILRNSFGKKFGSIS
jgi:hypothetical protein